MADHDEDEIRICDGCTKDEFLAKEIKESGETGVCGYCNKKRYTITLEYLADRIEEIVQEHYRRVPDEPDNYDGTPIAYLISEIAGVSEKTGESIRDFLEDRSKWQCHEEGRSNPYESYAYYEERAAAICDFKDIWDAFRDEVTLKSRFFSQDAKSYLDEIFGKLSDHHTWQGEKAVQTIDPKSKNRFVYRGRVASTENDIKTFLKDPINELGAPTSKKAKAGRMNPHGIPVFYAALDEETCISEVRSPVGAHVVIGKFEFVRKVKILDLDVLSQTAVKGSMFDPSYSSRCKRIAFLGYLIREISRPIMPRDEEFDYLPTQVIAEYLASCIKPKLDGVVFHSSQTAGKGKNIVLFNHARIVEPYILPEGTKVDFNMGWATEDDYDRNIFISETTPSLSAKNSKEKNQKKSSKIETPDLLKILQNQILQGQKSESEIDVDFEKEITLRLLVNEINVFAINATSYASTTRRVTRYRSSEDDETPF